jgi:TolB-like protein/tRNA A-37 threonylcarbamoyl transferase component Bud32/tetratricopeptide (TPR) repeat protein
VADVLEQLRAALGDRYEVERLVGEGGMATVYLARDLRHGRKVAIKTLRAELAASIGADRFLREIRLAANLQHPNVLALYDSGEADGILYYVMPFIEGESLRDRLNREQQLPLHDAVRITREAAEGLAYAHDHGVVHRDIKPENILLQNGHALVADFGIARAADAAGEKLTQTGMAVGTPHYMSPEQSLGADHADVRSDIYSLGCVLYELLAGQPPFDGPNSRAILARHAMEQVPSIRIVRQSVPEELEDAVLQSLEKVPADRFQKMSEMADLLADLETTVATRRTTSRGVPAVRRGTSGGVKAVKRTTPVAILGEKWGTGVRLWSVAGMLLAVLVVGGVAVWRLAFASGTSAGGAEGVGPDPNKIAVLYFEKGSGASDSLGYLAEGLTEALINELSGVQGLQVISSNGVRPYRNKDVPIAEIARQLQAGTMVSGSLLQSGNRLRVNVSLVNANTGVTIGSKTLERPREEVFALQDELAKEVAVFLRQELGREMTLKTSRAGTRVVAAWELLGKARSEALGVDPLITAGDTAAAARQYRRADSLLAEAEALDPAWGAPAVQRGWIAYRLARLGGSTEKAPNDEWTRKGLAHAEQALRLAPKDPDALELQGTLLYYRWLLNLEPDSKKAADLLIAAERDLRASVEANPNQASAWNSLSHLLINKNETAEAKLAARRAFESDPYLANADLTLDRLFSTSVDLEDPVEANHWCQEGFSRFPSNPRFTECQIWTLFLKGQSPDVDRAWQLLEQYVNLNPPEARDYERRRGQMIVSVVIARAASQGRKELRDSAEAVMLQARLDADSDPTRELALWEAVARTLLGERDEAFRQLHTYLASNPQQRRTLAKERTWWFRPLHDDSRWSALVGGGA